MIMKERLLAILVLTFMSLTVVNACTLNTELVNQDPYPTTPNNYVKLVFELSGVANADCTDISFELNLPYPFSYSCFV